LFYFGQVAKTEDKNTRTVLLYLLSRSGTW